MAFFLGFGDRVGLEVFDSFLIEALTSLKYFAFAFAFAFKDMFGAFLLYLSLYHDYFVCSY